MPSQSDVSNVKITVKDNVRVIITEHILHIWLKRLQLFTDLSIGLTRVKNFEAVDFGENGR